MLWDGDGGIDSVEYFINIIVYCLDNHRLVNIIGLYDFVHEHNIITCGDNHRNFVFFGNHLH